MSLLMSRMLEFIFRANTASSVAETPVTHTN